MNRIPENLDIDSPEYQKWKEDYLNDCGLYARHIIADDLEKEEHLRRSHGKAVQDHSGPAAD